MSRYVIHVGSLTMLLFEAAMCNDFDKTTPRIKHAATFKKVPGIVQLSIGKKHALENIIVKIHSPENYSKYTLRKGTKVVGQANSIQSALRYFRVS